MKKALYATTAIVAAAVAVPAYANVELSLGGGIRVGVGFGGFRDGENQNDIEKDFHVITDGEIHFRGSGTLDNGIQIVTRVELEAVSESDTIDEQWVQVRSQFGTLMIGGNDSAAASTGYVGFTGYGLGGASWDGSYDFVPADIGTFADTDALGIHYYTPNIAGFEIGVSWQPTTTDATATIDTDGDLTNSDDRYTVGAAYSNTFGDVDFVIGGGYAVDEGETADPYAWGIGAEVGFGGFGVQGRYEMSDDDAGTEATRFGAGVTYGTGPWSFGVAGAFEDTDAATDVEEYIIGGGVAYELGDGVDVGGHVQYGNYDADGQDDVEGFGAAILLGVAF